MNKLMCTYVLYIHIRYNSSLIFLFTLYHRFHLSAIYILRPMPACFSIYIGPSVCLSLYLCVSLSVRLSVRLWFDWPSVTASRSQLYSICWMYHYIQGVSKLCVFFAWNCKYNRYVSLKIFRYYLTKKLAWKTFYF